MASKYWVYPPTEVKKAKERVKMKHAMFKKEKKEHPTFTNEQIHTIVRDHFAKKR